MFGFVTPFVRSTIEVAEAQIVLYGEVFVVVPKIFHPANKVFWCNFSFAVSPVLFVRYESTEAQEVLFIKNQAKGRILPVFAEICE